MPPQDLPPGLYDHPLSEAEHQAFASQLASLHQLEPLDPPKHPSDWPATCGSSVRSLWRRYRRLSGSSSWPW